MDRSADRPSVQLVWLASGRPLLESLEPRFLLTALQLDDSTKGSITQAFEADYFDLAVQKGQRYEFTTTLGSLDDSVLSLYTEDLDFLIENDDTEADDVSLSSRIIWTATFTGTVQLHVQGYDDASTGTYWLLANTYTGDEPDTMLYDEEDEQWVDDENSDEGDWLDDGEGEDEEWDDSEDSSDEWNGEEDDEWSDEEDSTDEGYDEGEEWLDDEEWADDEQWTDDEEWIDAEDGTGSDDDPIVIDSPGYGCWDHYLTNAVMWEIDTVFTVDIDAETEPQIETASDSQTNTPADAPGEGASISDNSHSSFTDEPAFHPVRVWPVRPQGLSCLTTYVFTTDRELLVKGITGLPRSTERIRAAAPGTPKSPAPQHTPTPSSPDSSPTPNALPVLHATPEPTPFTSLTPISEDLFSQDDLINSPSAVF